MPAAEDHGVQVHLDQVLASRDLSLTELSERVGVSIVNLSLEERPRQGDPAHRSRRDLQGLGLPTRRPAHPPSGRMRSRQHGASAVRKTRRRWIRRQREELVATTRSKTHHPDRFIDAARDASSIDELFEAFPLKKLDVVGPVNDVTAWLRSMRNT
jgi:hypothetical protein